MKVAAIQHDISWEQPARNFERLAPVVEEAASAGARLIVLSEMFSTGFSLDAERIAEDADGPSCQFLVELASRLGVWVTGSIPTKARAGASSPLPTNCMVIAAPDSTIHRYDKIHPFSYAGEHEHFAAGADVVTVVVDGIRVTPFVCYDLRFADVWWSRAAGTDVYLCVANWPASRQAHWRILLKARAIENQAFVLGVNRVGSGGRVDYVGGSMLVDPFGDTVAEAAGATEECVFGEVDPQRVTDIRAKFPFLGDRRVGF